MVYEAYLQLLNRAGDRQLSRPRRALTHNLGGFPNNNICSISILGMLGS
jgi:acetyl-CoA C-acetyltransferase